MSTLTAGVFGQAPTPTLLTSGGQRSAPGQQADAVPDTQDGPHEARLVYRPAAELRPHPIYLELCGPIPAIRVKQVAQQTEAMCEPLSVTTDGTILDGLRRWQAAIEQHQPSLPCLEYELTEEEALQFLIARHRTSEGLNAFCRTVLALSLERYFREGAQNIRRTGSTASNLTNVDRIDVRPDIARVAHVSTGNVTKVKQLLETAIPEVRERLSRGEVSIHRAWQWRTLTAKAQRDALWEHLHRGAIKTTIARLVRGHADAGAPVRSPDVAAIVLGGLAIFDAADITVGVVDVPGRAVVVTRACYDELQEKHSR